VRDSLHHPYAHWMSLLVALTRCPTVHCKSKGKSRHTMVKLQPSDGWQMWDCSHNVPTTVLEVHRCNMSCTVDSEHTVSGCHRKPRRTAFPSSNVKCCTGSNTHILCVDGYLSRSREVTNTPDPLCFHIMWAINRVERKNGNEYTSISCQTPTNTGILTMSYLRRKSGCGSHPGSGRMRGTPCVPVVPCSPGHSLPLSSGCKWNKCCLGDASHWLLSQGNLTTTPVKIWLPFGPKNAC